MKVAKAIEIANLTSGQIIGEITGKVKKVFPPKTGQGNFGPWSVRNIILQDETGEVRAGVWNIEMQDLEGKTVTFKSTPSKNGMAGISVSENKGKNELKITEKCIVLDGGASVSTSQQQSAGSTLAIKSTGLSAKERIFQNAQLMVECIKAAVWVQGEVKELTNEHFQSVCASLFIASERAGLAATFPTSLKKEEVSEETKPVDEDDLGW
jgi:hypothetical protein